MLTAQELSDFTQAGPLESFYYRTQRDRRYWNGWDNSDIHRPVPHVGLIIDDFGNLTPIN